MRTMKSPGLVLVCLGLAAGAAFAQNRPPVVVLPPPVIVVPQPPVDAPPEPFLNEADAVMNELGACLADGVTELVACLRDRHSSVMIRRLEDCLRSERIPQDPAETRACLAVGLR